MDNMPKQLIVFPYEKNKVVDFIKTMFKPLTRFIRRVKRLSEFVPKIWNSYDWDHSYATGLFKYQLERMVKHLEENKPHYGWEQDVNRIKTAIELLERVDSDYYLMKYVDEAEKKYGPTNLDLREIDTPGHYALVRTFEKGYSLEEEKEIEKEFYRAIKEGTILQAKARRILWKFIEHNIENWWS